MREGYTVTPDGDTYRSLTLTFCGQELRFENTSRCRGGGDVVNIQREKRNPGGLPDGPLDKDSCCQL